MGVPSAQIYVVTHAPKILNHCDFLGSFERGSSHDSCDKLTHSQLIKFLKTTGTTSNLETNPIYSMGLSFLETKFKLEHRLKQLCYLS